MYPQILLLGNGLNKTYDADGWDDLIKKIHCNRKIDPEVMKEVSFPLKAVLATDDHLDSQIASNRGLFFGLNSIDCIRPLMENILRIPFDHILTTNYSYEIERVANRKVKADGEYCKRLARTMLKNGRVDQKYLLHSYNEIFFENHYQKIWHIHGEARKRQSIVLGHYYYGKLLSLFINHLENMGNEQYQHQKIGGSPIIRSWLDAFIMGDVYVLGYGFDFSEMDLWWLLNRKKRENAKHGSVYFYEPSQGNEVKHSLLEVYGAKIERLGFITKPVRYEDFYRCAIEDICSKVLGKKEEEISGV